MALNMFGNMYSKEPAIGCEWYKYEEIASAGFEITWESEPFLKKKELNYFNATLSARGFEYDVFVVTTTDDADLVICIRMDLLSKIADDLPAEGERLIRVFSNEADGRFIKSFIFIPISIVLYIILFIAIYNSGIMYFSGSGTSKELVECIVMCVVLIIGCLYFSHEGLCSLFIRKKY